MSCVPSRFKFLFSHLEPRELGKIDANSSLSYTRHGSFELITPALNFWFLKIIAGFTPTAIFADLNSKARSAMMLFVVLQASAPELVSWVCSLRSDDCRPGGFRQRGTCTHRN